MKRLDFFPGFVIREKQQTFNPFVERPVEQRQVEQRPVEQRPVEQRQLEQRPVEQRQVEQRPVEQRQLEQRPVEQRQVEQRQVNPFEQVEQIKLEKPKVSKPVPFDQPRSKDGERLLYKYPNLPTVNVKGAGEYDVLVGSSDKSATAWLLQFDGAANPNPGPASSGAVLWSPADERGKRSPVLEMGKFIGKNTNNVAEIQGLLLGLKMAAMRNVRDILIEGDSELIINQQIGKYKVSHKNLKVWWSEIQAAMMDETSFDWIAIRHVRRELNERADSITKEVLSKKQGFTRVS